MEQHAGIRSPLNSIVIAAALGYFVDIYDLILFGVVKDPSLRDLGVAPSMIFYEGSRLLSMQVLGMLAGGIIWGILGDKKGRLSTMFMTIIVYSVANILNGFVHDLHWYAVLRFIAGVGLAGELGVGITLVMEVMHKETRVMGTSLVAGVGVMGAVLAFTVAEQFNWRIAYYTGGGLGLLLLVLRMAVYESGMFEKMKSEKVSRGNFFLLFTSLARFKNYLFLILTGIPTWLIIGVLTINASVFGSEALHLATPVKGSTCILILYLGASLGSFLLGIISRKMQSRKKAMLLAIGVAALLVAVFFSLSGAPAWMFYTLMFFMGVPSGGIWVIFMTSASEMFGTNVRATVTTTAPNFVRGSTALILLLLNALKPAYGLWTAGVIIAAMCLVIPAIAAIFVQETYHSDLNYTEN
jgi:MFS transporter, putative metabolite:H+ symporter